MVFMTRVVYEFSLHDVNGCPFFMGAKRGELKGAKKEERLWLFLVSRGFAARPSRVLALQSVKEKEETARNRKSQSKPFRRSRSEQNHNKDETVRN